MYRPFWHPLYKLHKYVSRTRTRRGIGYRIRYRVESTCIISLCAPVIRPSGPTRYPSRHNSSRSVPSPLVSRPREPQRQTPQKKGQQRPDFTRSVQRGRASSRVQRGRVQRPARGRTYVDARSASSLSRQPLSSLAHAVATAAAAEPHSLRTTPNLSNPTLAAGLRA